MDGKAIPVKFFLVQSSLVAKDRKVIEGKLVCPV